jgi:hypothetical protein
MVRHSQLRQTDSHEVKFERDVNDNSETMKRLTCMMHSGTQ